MLIDVVITAHEEKLHGGDDLIIGKHDVRDRLSDIRNGNRRWGDVGSGQEAPDGRKWDADFRRDITDAQASELQALDTPAP
jgi:hypothetical protein